MHQPAPFRGEANTSLAHILAHAIESSDKPKHQIAREVGIHRETLLRVMRGDRPIGLDEAARVLDVCGAFPRASMILALADFFTALPGQLERTLGRRVEDLRPRWANGTSQLVARMLAKHIDDFANRDISMALPR